MRGVIIVCALLGATGAGGYGTKWLISYYEQKAEVEEMRRKVAAGARPDLEPALKQIDDGIVAAYTLLGESAFCALAILLVLDRRYLVAGLLLFAAFFVPVGVSKNPCMPCVTAGTALAGLFSFVAAVFARIEQRLHPPKPGPGLPPLDRGWN